MIKILKAARTKIETPPKRVPNKISLRLNKKLVPEKNKTLSSQEHSPQKVGTPGENEVKIKGDGQKRPYL